MQGCKSMDENELCRKYTESIFSSNLFDELWWTWWVKHFYQVHCYWLFVQTMLEIGLHNVFLLPAWLSLCSTWLLWLLNGCLSRSLHVWTSNSWILRSGKVPWLSLPDLVSGCLRDFSETCQRDLSLCWTCRILCCVSVHAKCMADRMPVSWPVRLRGMTTAIDIKDRQSQTIVGPSHHWITNSAKTVLLGYW